MINIPILSFLLIFPLIGVFVIFLLNKKDENYNKKVKEIAYLARLNLEDSDIEQTTTELNNILSLMDKLGEIDTGDAEPMAHPLEMSQRLREDKVSEEDMSKEFPLA